MVVRICVGVVVVPCKESAGAIQAINRSRRKQLDPVDIGSNINLGTADCLLIQCVSSSTM